MIRCYMDLKGSELFPVEVGLILYSDYIFYSQVMYGRIQYANEFLKTRCVSHGMSATYLNTHGIPQLFLQQNVRDFMAMHQVNEIIGSTPTVKTFLKLCKITHIPFVYIPTPEGCIPSYFHIRAKQARRSKELIVSNYCNCDCVHPLSIPTQRGGKTEANCALYDAYRLALFDKWKCS